MSLLELLGVQLASFSKQIDIGGTEIVLHIAPAIYLATLINELAVNAVRRGALSLCSGRVSLQWSIDEQSDPAALRLRWEETGRPVSSPERTEFSPGTSKHWREISRSLHRLFTRRIHVRNDASLLDEGQFRTDKKEAVRSVSYKVIRLIGSSPNSWEDAAKAPLEEAANHLEDLRIAEVEQLDVRMQENKWSSIEPAFTHLSGIIRRSISGRNPASAILSGLRQGLDGFRTSYALALAFIASREQFASGNWMSIASGPHRNR